jgi:Domain of unknown function (DUF4386)
MQEHPFAEPAPRSAAKQEPEMSTTQTTTVTTDQAETGPRRNTSDTAAAAPGTNDRAFYRVAATAAFLALAALMVGGVAMSLTAQTGTSTADVLAAIDANPWPFLAGGVGLTLVSLFDIFTIPGLHAALGRHGRVLILLASATAIIGDLLGIVGRLAQTALVPVGLQTDDAGGGELLAAGHALDVLDTTINTAGFLLVSVSFTCFGLLMLRGFSRPIGWIAIVAGVFTLLGQIPPLMPLFMVANVAYFAWYVAIGRRFWRAARQR